MEVHSFYNFSNESKINAFNFLKSCETEINSLNFDQIYKKAADKCNQLNAQANLITWILLNSDIDPLSYMTYVPKYAYSSLSITEIDIPDNIDVIESHAFDNCADLIRVTLPSNLNKIGHQAFNYCTNIKCIDIPCTVTSISPEAFHRCSKLKTINYAGTQEQFESIYVFFNNDLVEDCVIHCSDGDMIVSECL